jgi:DNA-binding response OmpR family regulator
MRILVVEDELDIAQFLCQGLTEAGYVGYLRRKLERVKSSLTIQTLRGVGYRVTALEREHS